MFTHNQIFGIVVTTGIGLVCLNSGCSYSGASNTAATSKARSFSGPLNSAVPVAASNGNFIPQFVGLAYFKSKYPGDKGYLQSYTSPPDSKEGQMHASQKASNLRSEETWLLYKVALPDNKEAFLFRNWRNRRFLSIRDGGCVWCDASEFGLREMWAVEAGSDYGVVGPIAIRSLFNGNFIGANPPGTDNPECGGEVMAGSPAKPSPCPTMADWPGWWYPFHAVEPPEDKDFWSVLGDLARIAVPFIPKSK